MPKTELMEKAERLYQSGIKLVDIAAQLNIPPGTVRRWKSVKQWDKKRANAKTNVRHKNERSDESKVTNKRLIKSVESNEELTDAQKAFCLYYSKTFNATMAYKKAFGCDYASANAAGPRLLVNVSIRAEITRLKEIRSAGLLASADDVVEKYMHIAFADITDFLEFGRATVPVMGPFGPITVDDPDSEEKIALTKEINEVRFKESSEIDGTLLSEVKQGKDGASVKLADRMKALEWLANYFELNPSDRHKREFDKRKLEIELLKAQSSIKPDNDDTPPDDGFTEALNGKAADIWQDDDSAKGDDHVG